MGREIRINKRNLDNLRLGLEMYRELEFKISHCNTYEEAYEALLYDDHTEEDNYTEDNFNVENYNVEATVYNDDGKPVLSKCVNVYGAYGDKRICLYDNTDVEDIIYILESNGIDTEESTMGRSSQNKTDDWAY